MSAGDSAAKTERQSNMSENASTNASSSPTIENMKSGEEPTELLLLLAWSPIETLWKRGNVRIFTANGRVAVIFQDTDLSPEKGLIPTVGKPETTVIPTPTEEA